jgi:hypothetical protein
LPEIFDPATGQKLAQELNATAELLGFDPNEISDVAAIKALKVTSEWKTKADKYDALMKRKMETGPLRQEPAADHQAGDRKAPEQNRKARADQAWQPRSPRRADLNATTRLPHGQSRRASSRPVNTTRCHVG